MTNPTEIGTAILPPRRLTISALSDVSTSAQRPAPSDTPNSPARPGTPTAPPRRPPRFPALARAALACVLALAALATPALAQTTVPSNWSLKPNGLTTGAQFRLIFLSSMNRLGLDTDIAEYNTFIQDLVAAGHADIQAYSAGFRMVGCTADTDARDNTSTTGTGVPIYWLNGGKVADNYADFYDWRWFNEANDKNESGTNGPDTSRIFSYPMTGCDHDGTEVLRALGSSGGRVRVGRPNSTAEYHHGPLSNQTTNAFGSGPMYGLSAVFRVVAAPNTPATGAPMINGTAQVGQTLTATVGDIADVDGLPAPFLTDVDTSFQWIRVETDSTENDISGAMASTYAPTRWWRRTWAKRSR